MTDTIPKEHLSSGKLVDVVTQVFIRTEDNLFIFRKRFNHLPGIGRGDDNICQCFYSSCCIHIRDNRMIWMCLNKLFKLIRGTTLCEGTSCCKVRYKNPFLRAQYFCSLTHKMNTTQHNNVRSSFCSPLSQCQTITHKIGNVLYFRFLVVVSQYNGIFRFSEFIDVSNDFFFNHLLLIIYIVLKN